MSMSSFMKAQNEPQSPRRWPKMARDQVDADIKIPADYASVFWKCDYWRAKNCAEVTFGWCIINQMKSGNYSLQKGAWRFLRSFKQESVSELTGAVLVEEPVGVLAQNLSLDEGELSDQIERLIADNLLLFAHSVLFGQRPKTPPEGWPPAGLGSVDILLVISPALPKFQGRICYTHFNRHKTLAIITPGISKDHAPIKKDDWEKSSYPPLSEDSAIRRWKVRRSASRHKELSGEFSIIVPTGDSVAGAISDDLLTGGFLWDSKADTISSLLNQDWQSVRLMYWDEGPIFLPLGMREAARSAILYERIYKAAQDKKVLKESKDARSFAEFEDIFRNASSVANLREDIGDIILIKSWDKYRQGDRQLQEPGMQFQRPLFGESLAAKRQLPAEKRFVADDAIKKSIEELKKELGEDAVQ